MLTTVRSVRSQHEIGFDSTGHRQSIDSLKSAFAALNPGEASPYDREELLNAKSDMQAHGLKPADPARGLKPTDLVATQSGTEWSD